MSWDYAALAKIPTRGEIIARGDDRINAYHGDVVLVGHPDAVIRARDTKEVQEILAYCNGHRIPVTFAGGFTGLTGAASAEEGVLISTEQHGRVLDVGHKSGDTVLAVAEPGILVGDLKEQVSAAGFYYPPDPTSYREARLAGTVATNAKGEDAVLYGDTRRYIHALKIVLADGRLIELQRPQDNEVIDQFIGSEGTLGYLTEITVSLLPTPPEHWAAIGFFPDLFKALDFCVAAVDAEKVRPRALELLDRPSLDILRADPAIRKVPETAGAAIYWKQEDQKGKTRDALFAAWDKLLAKHAGFSDETWLAQTATEQEQFRRWRHLVPAHINETVHHFIPVGGGKVASDWWVPVKHIHEAMRAVLKDVQENGLKLICFGHMGQGHPHVNFIAHNADERRRGMALVRKQCERAVRWGGGVAGEHGFGKLFRDLVPIQFLPRQIKAMQKLKKHYDPHGILGRGNILT